MPKRVVLALLAVVLLWPASRSRGDQAAVTKSWFKSKVCTALEIKRYPSASRREVSATLRIEDPLVVRGLMERIAQIDPDGPMMIKLGPDVERIDLGFTCGTATETLQFYEKRLKTPSTGFHDAPNELETELYRDLDGLIAPTFDKRILKVKNLPVRYRSFSVVYLGDDHADGSPATGSATTERYEITDRRGKKQPVAVHSGQMPPGPQGLVVDKRKLSLVTYQTSRGERLYPAYFQIVQ